MTAVAVLGAGGVGGFVAGALARAGADVTVVARPETAAVLGQTGLRVSSRALGEDFTATPRVTTEIGDPLDVLFVATKATGLATALGRVRGTPGLIVPLLNGLEHLHVLRGRFGAERVAAAVIRIEADRPSVGVIVQTSPGVRVDMASLRPEPAAALAAAAAVLRDAGIEARIEDSEAQVMWSKLARLCALALTTSAADRPIGDVRSDPRWRSALDGAVSETVAVANAEGAGLQASDTLAELDAAHAELGSSMQRDIAAGRPTELDAIAGAVLRAGRRHGLRCPTVQWLAERVAVREAGGRPPTAVA
ncbi:MAG TPA: 2-dehydropantoate 2-reductase [Solirubrobacteraceae bacterium]|jgi:2-dehydropantoate 2-reductase|nr:2-dehydropantoate 2-reductase [Solirubrobacteraceae bacterium]